MAIPPDQTWQTYLDVTLNALVKMRDKTNDYYEDWGTLPPAVKSALKAKFAAAVATGKAALDDINSAVQGL